jgi:hypothetical protein
VIATRFIQRHARRLLRATNRRATLRSPTPSRDAQVAFGPVLRMARMRRTLGGVYLADAIDARKVA